MGKQIEVEIKALQKHTDPEVRKLANKYFVSNDLYGEASFYESIKPSLQNVKTIKEFIEANKYSYNNPNELLYTNSMGTYSAEQHIFTILETKFPAEIKNDAVISLLFAAKYFAFGLIYLTQNVRPLANKYLLALEYLFIAAKLETNDNAVKVVAEAAKKDVLQTINDKRYEVLPHHRLITAEYLVKGSSGQSIRYEKWLKPYNKNQDRDEKQNIKSNPLCDTKVGYDLLLELEKDLIQSPGFPVGRDAPQASFKDNLKYFTEEHKILLNLLLAQYYAEVRIDIDKAKEYLTTIKQQSVAAAINLALIDHEMQPGPNTALEAAKALLASYADFKNIPDDAKKIITVLVNLAEHARQEEKAGKYSSEDRIQICECLRKCYLEAHDYEKADQLIFDATLSEPHTQLDQTEESKLTPQQIIEKKEAQEKMVRTQNAWGDYELTQTTNPSNVSQKFDVAREHYKNVQKLELPRLYNYHVGKSWLQQGDEAVKRVSPDDAIEAYVNGVDHENIYCSIKILELIERKPDSTINKLIEIYQERDKQKDMQDTILLGFPHQGTLSSKISFFNELYLKPALSIAIKNQDTKAFTALLEYLTASNLLNILESHLSNSDSDHIRAFLLLIKDDSILLNKLLSSIPTLADFAKRLLGFAENTPLSDEGISAITQNNNLIAAILSAVAQHSEKDLNQILHDMPSLYAFCVSPEARTKLFAQKISSYDFWHNFILHAANLTKYKIINEDEYAAIFTEMIRAMAKHGLKQEVSKLILDMNVIQAYPILAQPKYREQMFRTIIDIPDTELDQKYFILRLIRVFVNYGVNEAESLLFYKNILNEKPSSDFKVCGILACYQELLYRSPFKESEKIIQEMETHLKGLKENEDKVKGSKEKTDISAYRDQLTDKLRDLITEGKKAREDIIQSESQSQLGFWKAAVGAYTPGILGLAQQIKINDRKIKNQKKSSDQTTAKKIDSKPYRELLSNLTQRKYELYSRKNQLGCEHSAIVMESINDALECNFTPDEQRKVFPFSFTLLLLANKMNATNPNLNVESHETYIRTHQYEIMLHVSFLLRDKMLNPGTKKQSLQEMVDVLKITSPLHDIIFYGLPAHAKLRPATHGPEIEKLYSSILQDLNVAERLLNQVPLAPTVMPQDTKRNQVPAPPPYSPESEVSQQSSAAKPNFLSEPLPSPYSPPPYVEPIKEQQPSAPSAPPLLPSSSLDPGADIVILPNPTPAPANETEKNFMHELSQRDLIIERQSVDLAKKDQIINAQQNDIMRLNSELELQRKKEELNKPVNLNVKFDSMLSMMEMMQKMMLNFKDEMKQRDEQHTTEMAERDRKHQAQINALEQQLKQNEERSTKLETKVEAFFTKSVPAESSSPPKEPESKVEEKPRTHSSFGLLHKDKQ